MLFLVYKNYIVIDIKLFFLQIYLIVLVKLLLSFVPLLVVSDKACLILAFELLS